MPRGPRLDTFNALHHVIARGIDRCSIFLADADRADFLERLAEVATVPRLSVYAWALMTTHLHLLLRTASAPLSRSMQSLLGGYAAAFNARHRRVGYLFQGRFKSILVDDDTYLLELVRYKADSSPAQSRDEPDTIGESVQTACLIVTFHKRPASPAARPSQTEGPLQDEQAGQLAVEAMDHRPFPSHAEAECAKGMIVGERHDPQPGCNLNGGMFIGTLCGLRDGRAEQLEDGTDAAVPVLLEQCGVPDEGLLSHTPLSGRRAGCMDVLHVR